MISHCHLVQFSSVLLPVQNRKKALRRKYARTYNQTADRYDLHEISRHKIFDTGNNSGGSKHVYLPVLVATERVNRIIGTRPFTKNRHRAIQLM